MLRDIPEKQNRSYRGERQADLCSLLSRNALTRGYDIMTLGLFFQCLNQLRLSSRHGPQSETPGDYNDRKVSDDFYLVTPS